jgi:hypothetical protein
MRKRVFTDEFILHFIIQSFDLPLEARGMVALSFTRLVMLWAEMPAAIAGMDYLRSDTVPQLSICPQLRISGFVEC